MKTFKLLRTLGIAEAQRSLATYARRLRKEPVIVTDRGKPLMVLVHVERDADVESVSLSMNPEFIAMIERSRALHKPGTGLSLEHVRRRGSRGTGRGSPGHSRSGSCRSRAETRPRGPRDRASRGSVGEEPSGRKPALCRHIGYEG
jgi:hypothetical protein